MKKKLSLGIVIDEKCNIQCDHCCFSSGPKSTNNINDDVILEIIEQATKISEITTIGLSGGEAMLRQPLVLAAIRKISNSHKRATLTSNGFWGVTPHHAEKIVKSLVDSGLSFITISYDDFHSDLLSPKRVSNVLNACKKYGLNSSINVAITKTKDGKRSLEKLGDSKSLSKIRFFPVTPAGKAKTIDSNELIRTNKSPKTLRCPGFEPTFHFDGNIYPCCSPSVFETELTVGAVGTTSVSEAMWKISHNAYFSVIRNDGFGWIAEQAKQYGLIEESKAVNIVDVCELCSIIGTNKKFLRSIAPDLIEYAKKIYEQNYAN